MNERPSKKRSRWPVVVMTLVLLLPPLYVASYGPAWAYVFHPKMPIKYFSEDKFYRIYWPLQKAADHSEAVGWALTTYGFWCDDHNIRLAL